MIQYDTIYIKVRNTQNILFLTLNVTKRPEQTTWNRSEDSEK